MTAVPDGAPDARGGEASVPFEARVTWRTPFGSVRRGAMSMQADLSRSGRAWRLATVRILRPIDLK
jgi:hypothetical protein